MRFYDVRALHWLDVRVLRHRILSLCRHLWCWHALCEGEIPSQRCQFCGETRP